MTNHTYQYGTIAQLRKIYETHTDEARDLSERAHQQLATAATHAALAHDAALLLDQTDPEWTAECEAPLVTRALRLRAWREMLDFLEAHPEIGISAYESLTITQLDGKPATPEYLDSLKDAGIHVKRSEKYATAELWFGNYDVKLGASAKLPEPEIEPVTDAAAIDEHQADAADAGEQPGEMLIADPTGIVSLDKAIVPPEDGEGPVDPDGAAEFIQSGITAYQAVSREQQPIQINDRVRVHSADVDGSRTDFPERFEGRKGIVTEVRADAFTADPGASGDAEDLPVDVALEGESEPHCFAVAEVEVLVTVEQRIATMDRLAGQPA